MSWFRKHGWWVLLALLAGIGQWRLRLDVDILNLLPPELPAVQGLKLYQHYFANLAISYISSLGMVTFTHPPAYVNFSA